MKMPEPRKEKANSVPEFLDIVLRMIREWERLSPDLEIWYRGINDCTLKLFPGLYWRKGVTNETEETTATLFRRTAPAFLDRVPTDDWEWYFLMQHYGLPTRLLDWTENALTALFFAVWQPKPNADPCVWMIDAGALNAITVDEDSGYPYLPGGRFTEHWLWHSCRKGAAPSKFDEDGKSRSNELPVAILAPCIDRRIIAQQSVFTLHGTSEVPIETVITQGPAPHRDMIARIVLLNSNISAIRAELDWLGLRESALFPEPQNLANDLRRQLEIE